MRTVVLVPWRSDDGPRQRAWEHVRPIVEETGFELFTGAPPDGDWNMALALQDAARKAGEWDQAIIWDADTVIPPARAVEVAASQPIRMTVLYNRLLRLSTAGSEALLEGQPVDENAASYIYQGPGWLPTAGCYLVTREIWETTGGLDPRFSGWGCEDTAFERVIRLVCGGIARVAGDAIALWHPRNKRNDPHYPDNLALLDRYKAARTPGAITKLINEWRLNGHAY